MQSVFDSANPTNRDVDIPYKKGVTKTTVIDFFVVSPNVEVKSVVVIPMGFACSDHEPVMMRINLPSCSGIRSNDLSVTN